MFSSFSKGFTTVQTAIAIALAGVLGTSATPYVMNVIDNAERNSLSYARSAFYSAVRTVHLAGILNGGSKVVIEGQVVELINGYPKASEQELLKVVDFSGFKIEENDTGNVRVWSPNKNYCFTYSQPTQASMNSPNQLISEVNSSQSTSCSS